MPLEELRTYQGRNPRPDDFDSYWDAALAEMKAVDPQVELIKHDTKAPFAEYYDLYFTGVGDARVYAKYLRPKNITKPCPAILLFHGYSGFSGDWCGYLSWVSQGFCVAALDCRGQSGYSEDTGGVTGNTFHGHIIRGLDDAPDKLLFRSIFLDCAQLAGIVMDMPEVDENHVGAAGSSQGGGLTLACAALEPRIKRAVPIYPFLTDYQRVYEMDLAREAYSEIVGYIRQRDPRHERTDEIFTKLGYIDVQHLAPRIGAEVLMQTGLVDTCCPASSQFAAYNKITSPKDVIVYPDFGHEWLLDSGDITLDFMCGLHS